jgi:hypothetical protein
MFSDSLIHIKFIFTRIIIKTLNKVDNMGKQFIPVLIDGISKRIYIDNLEKVYRQNKKPLIPIPAYRGPGLLRKQSQETEPESRELEL